MKTESGGKPYFKKAAVCINFLLFQYLYVSYFLFLLILFFTGSS